MTTDPATDGPRPPAPPPPVGPTDPEAPVLPEQTRDDVDVGWGGASWREEPDDDERFLRERPPHWD